ncbi:hypothetical protein PMAYCL1PPCAC_15917, partial [Pristionchus mayeri]
IAVIAMCLNAIALTLIFTKSRKAINQYRKLLVIFLICGIGFAILHLLTEPTCIVRENLFDLYASGWLTDMRFLCVYCGVVSMSFLILAMHYIYRAMVILNKATAIIEISNAMLLKIVVILIFDLIVWTILCVVFLSYRDVYEPTILRLTTDLTDFPTSDHGGRFMMFLGSVDDELNLPPFLAIFGMIIICGISLSTIVWSSVRIVTVLNDVQHRSSSWRKYNYQLFVALCLQFSGPLLLLYIPCIFYLMLPFVSGQGFRSPPWLLSLCYSLYPIVDPLVIIMFIREYRRGLINVLRRLVFLLSADDTTLVVSVS